jgi:transitional endoplasmic reticulum ATPase
MHEETIKSLLEALKFSPDNIPLRLHLAQVFMEAKKWGDAEIEFKEIIDRSPSQMQARQGLATACYEQGKFSMAYVVLEELSKQSELTPALHLLFAKVLLKEGENEKALDHYKKAVELDMFLKDEEMDRKFRMPATGGSVSKKQSGEEDEEDEAEEDDQDSAASRFKPERPSIKFENVGGMQKVKEEIQMKIIYPLTHPELYKAYGKQAGGGILLYGPPGCGKTFLARATAGEVNARFINIGINDILDMWIGSSEKNLHELFELARRNKPCVLFFDEVDALGANRSDMKHSASRHLINQFLSEMDGVNASNEGVLILAATNAPWHLDPAFRRPGRFDRIIFVQPPDQESRESILEVLLKGKPVEDINYKQLAEKTVEFSGADLMALIDNAVEEKLRESFKTGIPHPLSTRDLQKSVGKINPSTKEWFTQARNYALYANESGLYDDILNYLKIKK